MTPRRTFAPGLLAAACAINLALAGLAAAAPLWAVRCPATSTGFWENGAPIPDDAADDYLVVAFDDGVTTTFQGEMDLYAGCDAKAALVRCALGAEKAPAPSDAPNSNAPVRKILTYDRAAGALRVEAWPTASPANRRISIGRCRPESE